MPIAEVDTTQDGCCKEPVNREPTMDKLISSFLTCTSTISYDRNHGPIEHRDAAEHVVTIDGLVTYPLQLSVKDLANNFPQHSVTCALQCAGNRRHSMRTRLKEVHGVDWFDGAVMNAVWEGPRLRDILMAAKISQPEGAAQERHVQFASTGSTTQHDKYFGGSIPLVRALDPEMDVILALKVNGKPLPPRHGFPVRAVVPGCLGARSVKWLDRVTVSSKESPCFYQQRDYKVLPPEATDMQVAEQFWPQIPAMLEMPINSCVAIPTSDSTVVLPASGLLDVKGYAVPQGSAGPVTRVQVSGDGGTTWIEADLESGGRLASKWSWVLFSAKLRMNLGKGQAIYAKATDAAGHTQEEARSAWNVRGVGYCGHEAVVQLHVVEASRL